MKKRVSFFAVLLAVLTMLVPNVNATNLKENMSISKPFSFGKVDFQKYDENKDVSYYKVTVDVNEDVINTVLNQKPGNPTSNASLGSFYLGLQLKLGAAPYVKNGISYKDNNLEAAKEKLDASLEEEKKNPSSSNGFWVPYLFVQYYDNGTETWTTVKDKGDGTKSIAQNLVGKLGLENESELVYGTNYRFYMMDDLQYIVAWQYTDGEETVTEYANVSYEIKFPVSAKSGNNEYYYPTLEDALKSEVNTIVINENIEIANDLEIKSDKYVTIAKGVTVTVANGKTLTNKGTIENDGTIAGATVNDGNLYNSGAITGNVVSDGYLRNSGTVTGDVKNTGYVYNSGKVNGNVTNDGDLYTVGTITGTVEDSTGATLYKIELPKSNEIGGIGVRSNMVAAGETVILNPYVVIDGYEYKNLKAVYTKDGKNVEIKLTKKTEYGSTFYTFEMPAGDVKVTASIEKIENPETYDGILGYCITGAISVLGLIALVIATKYSKKEN